LDNKMGTVVNKSFLQVRKDIAKKSSKLMSFLQEHDGDWYDDAWTVKHLLRYEKLNDMLLDLSEEIFNIDELHDVPDYDNKKKK
jgi:hypothetical protein